MSGLKKSSSILDWSEEIEGEVEKDQSIMESKENTNSRKRPRPKNKNDSESKQQPTQQKQRRTIEFETDPQVLQRRQKQIDYGKNTVGYHNYLQQVPVAKRAKEHPKTPEKYLKYSRRSWDALIKLWRKKLHAFDPISTEDPGLESDSDETL